MSEPDKRDQFLIAMYNQLMNDINRHIIVVWQSIATPQDGPGIGALDKTVGVGAWEGMTPVANRRQSPAERGEI